jgi:DNA-binding transcriptional regulator LsrR (DeoR family)
MTNEQKFQVAAMNASGMSIDEIVLDTKLDRQEVEDLVKERNDKRKTISEATKRAVIEWYQSGHTEKACAKKFGISPASAHRIIAAAKEKEPTPAPTETSSNENIVQVQNTTSKPESQALRGVNVLGLIQTMLEEAYGTDAEIMSLKADSDTASIVFRYGGKAYSVQFGLAF